MNKRKKLGRGLEDFSHLFISSENAETRPDEDSHTKKVEAAKKCSKVIVVLGGAGEPCSSFLTLNLAVELSSEGNKVVIINTEGRAPHMNLFLESIPSSSSLSLGKNVKKDNIRKKSGNIRHVLMDIDISSSDYLSEEEKGAIGQTLKEIEDEADIVLVTITNNQIHGLKSIIENVSEFIVSTPAYPVGMVEAYSIIKKVFLLNPAARLGLIVNESEQGEESRKIFSRIENVTKKHLKKSVYYLGTIYKEPAIEESVKSRMPLNQFKGDSQNILSFNEIAQSLCTVPYRQETSDTEHFQGKNLAEILQLNLNGYRNKTYCNQ